MDSGILEDIDMSILAQFGPEVEGFDEELQTLPRISLHRAFYALKCCNYMRNSKKMVILASFKH